MTEFNDLAFGCDFLMDWDLFFKEIITPIMNTKTNSFFTSEVKDAWAKLAVTINVDKL